MSTGNAAVRQWMSSRERFADLYNGCLFGGNQIILPEDLEPAESEANILLADKDGKTQELRRHRDIVMRWKKGALLVMLACENQAKIHYAMPVRNMLYDSLSYTEQIRNLWEQHKSEKMRSEEFLSKFRKGDCIFPVITVVFYYGEEKWDASVELYEMFPKELREKEALLKKYTANYKINLIDAGHLEDRESLGNFHTDLQTIFGMLQCRQTAAELLSYVNENGDYFRNVDNDTYYVIREFLHSDQIWKQEIRQRSGKGTDDMCKALEELYNNGIEKGRSEGISQGRSEGIRQGISEGRSQGEKEKLLKQVQIKLTKGKSVAEIADALEESEEAVKALIEELKGKEALCMPE